MDLIKRFLQKPEYVFKPKQIGNRLRYKSVVKKNEKQLVILPWGIPIEINLREVIGKSIFLFGLYDLSLTEAIKRIAKRGDEVFDVGANIGYISGLLSHLVGSEGRVHSFEPHPLIASKLRDNLKYVSGKLGYSNVDVYQMALSESAGESRLYVPTFFDENEGTSSLEKMNESKEIAIQTNTLDNYIANKLMINLLKIDVEGHELSVFKGAAQALQQKRIRHIIFENNSNLKIFDILKSYGYFLFRINKTFRGVVLSDIGDVRYKISYEADNFLATLFPGEIKEAFEKRGWTIYK